MPWTETARREYRRDNARYASDLTDPEWRLIEPFMPPANKYGRPRTTDLREVMNAILYLVSSGCAWALLPNSAMIFAFSGCPTWSEEADRLHRLPAITVICASKPAAMLSTMP